MKGDVDTPFEIDRAACDEGAGRLARFLARETEAEDRVAVLAGNSMDFVFARLAATAAQRVLVPVNPKLAAEEVAYVLEHSRATLLLCARELRDVGDDACASLARAPAVVTIGDLVGVVGAGEAAPLNPGPAEATGATLIYTSGTTGFPKGCLRQEAQEAARASELIETYGLGAGDVHLIACPLAHSAPGIFLRAGLRVGATTHVMARFRPQAFLAAVEATGASFFFLVPTQYERLLALPDEVRDAYDISSIRCALVAGAPIAPATKERLVAWLGPDKLWEFYGSSETGTVTVLAPADQLRKPGSVGRPAPDVELRIITEDGRDAADGQVGEIFVRSPTLMSGYLDGEQVHHPDERGGFVSVGDLGKRDAEGYLYLVDRKHDTIISGGVNVYPAEVERALAAHPSVVGAVAFGLDDPDWGQIVCAAVACRDQPQDAGARVDELRAFLREHVAAFKIPKAMAVIAPAELPVGSSGKPLRRRARAELSERLIRPLKPRR